MLISIYLFTDHFLTSSLYDWICIMMFSFVLLPFSRAAEFIIYKLKEMGKITQEDIRLVMEEFEALDVDQSGTLSVSDLTLAQSSQT